ncbi:hypothetical protein [Ancylobacter sp. G4_0304]|uniref:hypothetical protein n=1 Tax=Ancylobacter sp. G4_0304 TaxID=3114289 RepID=UPI0039C5E21D
MCEDCFDESEVPGERPSLPRLMQAARHIERDFPGEAVPNEAWVIYLGRRSGTIDWPAMQRIARAMEAAGLLLSLIPGGDLRN